MIKSFFEEAIYSNNFHRGELQLIDDSIQTLLAKNSGVGVVGGYYKKGIPICLISSLALTALGYESEEEFEEKTDNQFANCLTDKDADLRETENFRAFQGEKIVPLRTKSGTERVFRLYKDERSFADGNTVWLLTICDYDELNRREQGLIEARNAAEAANQAKTDFLSRMSHDIRTPLNGILGMTHIAQEHADDPQIVTDALEKLASAGTQLLTLVNDVLDMNRLESGKVELLHQPFNLHEILVQDGDIHHAQIAKKNLHTTVRFNQEHSYVIGSPLHIQRIVTNISSNAIKYNKEGGSIDYTLDEIPIDEKHSLYRFTVSDTGIGMSEDFQKHLYEPFARENETQHTERKGTGLGMAIVKELVERMNGTIAVHSKPGAGTTFVIEIPLELDLSKQHEEPKVTEPRPDLKNMRILLAEDNELNREIAQYILMTAGAAVECAVDGNEALEKFLKSGRDGNPPFQAILMDVVMPEMDGLETTRRIRESDHPQAKTIPIIAQTANAFTEDVRKTYESGMNDHISKPLDEALLLRILAKYKARQV